MRKSNLTRKFEESRKRKRQSEIIAMKRIREYKQTIGDVITSSDFHPSGHIRHSKR